MHIHPGFIVLNETLKYLQCFMLSEVGTQITKNIWSDLIRFCSTMLLKFGLNIEVRGNFTYIMAPAMHFQK